MKKINALWASFVKLFAWRQIWQEDVLAICASYRYNVNEDGVEVQWKKGSRIITNWIPQRRLRIDTTGRVAADKTLAEVRGNSCRLTMGKERYGMYLTSWANLHAKRC